MIKLPGIGDYTASMILSITFNRNSHIPIDGNIKRIMSRLYLISYNQQKMKNYKQYARNYISPCNPGDSIQALMDIGREICKPQAPDCIHCPLNKYCKAFNKNVVSQYPIKKNKKRIPEYKIVVGLIWKNNKFLISKRLKNSLLGNLWELPGGKIQQNETIVNIKE